MRTLALATVALLFVVNCSASLPADCEEISYETRQVEVLVECVQVVPVTNCVEETVSFEMPIDSTAEPGDKPAPDDAEPTEKMCKEPETETVETTVLIQCSDLVIRTTLEPQLVSYEHPVNSPNCQPPSARARTLNAPSTESLPPVPISMIIPQGTTHTPCPNCQKHPYHHPSICVDRGLWNDCRQ